VAGGCTGAAVGVAVGAQAAKIKVEATSKPIIRIDRAFIKVILLQGWETEFNKTTSRGRLFHSILHHLLSEGNSWVAS
jgi:hypothetical protein